MARYSSMRIILCIMMFCLLPVSAFTIEVEDEALFVRRIVEFWREEEYEIVKSQIEDFFYIYPESDFADKLYLMLGDTYFIQKKYSLALETYDKIQDPVLKKKTDTNRYHALYLSEKFTYLEIALSPTTTNLDKATLTTPHQQLLAFYYAESLFRSSHTMTDVRKRKKRYRQAEHYYRRLLDSPYRASSLHSLAMIAKYCGDYEKASGYFLELSASRPLRKEECIFRAASLQAHYDPEAAYTNFSHIASLDSPYASEASFLCLQILYDMKRYDEIIDSYEHFISSLPEEKLPLLQFFTGLSYHASQQYHQALTYLLPFVEGEIQETEKAKAALLSIVSSAYFLEDYPLLNKTVTTMQKHYPDDPALAKAFFFQGLSYKDADDPSHAQQLFRSIIDTYPSSPEWESALYEYSAILFSQSLWQKSHDSFSTFVAEHPESSSLSSAKRHLLYASISLYKQQENEGAISPNLRQQLIHDLVTALDYPGVLAEKELPEFTLLLAKTTYEGKEYEKALEILRQYLKQFHGHEDLYQAHFLIALCYYEAFHDVDAFTFHAEQVLALKPDVPDKSNIEINLFNAYLQQSQEVSEGEEKDRLLQRAAEHLFNATIVGNVTIKEENALWLANYYYQKARESTHFSYEDIFTTDGTISTFATMSLNVFLTIIDPYTIDLTEENITLEAEVLKVVALFAKQGNNDGIIRIATNMRHHYNDLHDLPWKHRGRALLYFGATHQHLGHNTEATEIYQEIIASHRFLSQYAVSTAKLLFARLEFKRLPGAHWEKTDNNVIRILSLLKEVKIRRSLSNEPIHLEAAIDYSDIQALLEPQDSRNAHLLSLLSKVKEDFTAQDDIISKDYHAMRELMPEKDLVYQAYIMLLDARISLLRGKIAQERDNKNHAVHAFETAEMIFKSLIKGRFAVSQYLIDQATIGLNDVRSSITLQFEGYDE